MCQLIGGEITIVADSSRSGCWILYFYLVFGGFFLIENILVSCQLIEEHLIVELVIRKKREDFVSSNFTNKLDASLKTRL